MLDRFQNMSIAQIAPYISERKPFQTNLLKIEPHILYPNTYFPLVSYGCETWSLISREEHRLRVSENRVLRRIFGPKRDEVTGGWRKLHEEELHNLNSSLTVIRMIKSKRMSLAGHVVRMRRGLHIGYWWESQKERDH
jgi:hypothetical protein